MKRFVFVLVVVLLAACSGPTQSPANSPAETPLFTDADFDRAVKQPAIQEIELFGSQESAATLRELPPLADVPVTDGQNELSAQGVLSNWNSFFTYAVHNSQVNVDGSPASPPYSIYYHETVDGVTSTRLLYEGYRQIQSLEGDVVSMRETRDPGSDFEIFHFDWHYNSQDNVVDIDIYQLTFDNVDNTNPSVGGLSIYPSGDFTYQMPMNGKDTVVIRNIKFPSENRVLNHPDPQRDPSGDRYIVLVRDPVDGNDSIQLYNTYINTYSTIAESPSPTTRLDSPSITSGGQQILWLETASNGFQEIKLANLIKRSVQTVASGRNLAYPRIDHSGLFMTYQEGRNIVVKNFETGKAEVVLAPQTDFTEYYSATGEFSEPSRGFLRVNISGLPSGQKRVRVAGGGYNGAFFGTSKTIGPLSPSLDVITPYTVSAQSFRVGDGKPSCKEYLGFPATQTPIIVAGQTTTVNVTYNVEPCD